MVFSSSHFDGRKKNLVNRHRSYMWGRMMLTNLQNYVKFLAIVKSLLVKKFFWDLLDDTLQMNVGEKFFRECMRWKYEENKNTIIWSNQPRFPSLLPTTCSSTTQSGYYSRDLFAQQENPKFLCQSQWVISSLTSIAAPLYYPLGKCRCCQKHPRSLLWSPIVQPTTTIYFG